MEPILFFGTKGDYGFLSNFADYPLNLKGKRWPTVEHFFQAKKFAGFPHEEEIRMAENPKTAKKMGGNRSWPLRPDWERVKDNIMREAVMAKFSQHHELREKLLATGDAELVEHSGHDAYWGDGGDGSGKNMLGTILMEVREKLNAERTQS